MNESPIIIQDQHEHNAAKRVLSLVEDGYAQEHALAFVLRNQPSLRPITEQGVRNNLDALTHH